MDFTDVEFFLIQAFVLSRYKQVAEHEISYGIDYDKLCHELTISSKTYAKKLVHHLQRNMSNMSCQFILTLLNDLGGNQELLYLLKSLYFTDEVGRHVMPCYEISKILLQHMKKMSTYVKIIVEQITDSSSKTISFLLRPVHGQNYILAEGEQEINDGDAVVIFKGIVKYRNNTLESSEIYVTRFFHIGLEDVILSNMAQHPQYAGVTLADKKINPYPFIDASFQEQIYNGYLRQAEEQFIAHKQQAALIGCTPDNPSLFLLTHVRCDRIHKSTVHYADQFNFNPKLDREELVL